MERKRARLIVGGLMVVMLLVFLVFLVVKKVSFREEPVAEVVASNFVGYDSLRAVIGDEGEVSMILKPGVSAHEYEPTPEDIANIKKAKLLVYVGGESDEWIRKLIDTNEIASEKTLRLMNLVELKEEEVGEGMESEEEDDEYDEHIWTSPRNMILMVGGIKDKLAAIYPEKSTVFEKNYQKYVKRLEQIDRDFREIVRNSNKKKLIFGDRFPFLYFVKEYGLEYAAAFAGCAEQVEASSKTIATLVDEAKKADIKVILKIELTSDKLAKTIAEEVGAQVMVLNSAHNVSQEDFEKGVTYADIMEENLKVLEEALR